MSTRDVISSTTDLRAARIMRAGELFAARRDLYSLDALLRLRVRRRTILSLQLQQRPVQRPARVRGDSSKLGRGRAGDSRSPGTVARRTLLS